MGLTKNSCRLLLDVGGTFLKSAVADAAGRLLPGSEFSCPVRSEGSRAEIEGSLAATVARGAAFAAERGMELAGIGIAIPGPFDYAAGVSRMTHKFRSICGVDLRGVLHAMPGVPADAEIRFMQDVNAALAGEIARGNAAGYGASALVSLGTGLGFALSRDGRVLCNPAGGPKVVIFNLPYRDGILEDYASKRGFLRIYGELAGHTDPALTVADLGRMAGEGDARARETFATVGGILAAALRDLLVEHGVECLLLGGQISRSFAYMEAALRDGLRDVAGLTRIAPAEHIGEAAFYGLLAQADGGC